MIGQSFGSDATRYVQDKLRGGVHKIEYFAHNHYVQTLFNLGLVGLIGFLAVSAYATIGLYRLCASAQGDGVADLNIGQGHYVVDNNWWIGGSIVQSAQPCLVIPVDNGQYNLTFAGNSGQHGKTILPQPTYRQGRKAAS